MSFRELLRKMSDDWKWGGSMLPFSFIATISNLSNAKDLNVKTTQIEMNFAKVVNCAAAFENCVIWDSFEERADI